ncbi:MAG: DUF1648 domain-containing protein [Haliscomenobacter sp.]|nr:DUF1648 domain-containing protein [Haliscomenobacter sp.]
MDARPKINLEQTTLDQLLEWAGWGMLIVSWGLFAKHLPQLPDVIPIHFNARGIPDGYGSKAILWALPVVATVFYSGLTILNRFPHLFNYPVRIVPENARRQYLLATRLIRYLKLSLVLVFYFLLRGAIETAAGRAPGLGAWFLPLVLGLVFIPLVVFLIQSMRARRDSGIPSK